MVKGLIPSIKALCVDFNRIIFGISVAGLGHVFPKLLANDTKLKTCSEKIKTVTSQAFQVWTDIEYSGLCYSHKPENGEDPILSGF
jgi:hypothetical protein